MKSTGHLIICAFAFLYLAASIHAQSPREQLQQMTVQLQQTPNDNALRERIIKLAAEIKPVPAVPEEARRSFVEGVNIVKLAKDAGVQKLAIGSFTEALKIAPWWGDAYYNLAVAQELTGQLNDAERTLKWFLLTNPGESEAREAQDRIYGLSAKRKLAIAEAGAKQEQAAQEAQPFIGNWIRDYTNNRGSMLRTTLSIKYSPVDSWRIVRYTSLNNAQMTDSGDLPYDIQLLGTELRYKVDDAIQLRGRIEVWATYKASATLSADRNTLRLAKTPMPLTDIQKEYAAGMDSWPSPYIDEYKRQ